MPRPCTDEENEIIAQINDFLDQYELTEAERYEKFAELLKIKAGTDCCVRLVEGETELYEVYEEGE